MCTVAFITTGYDEISIALCNYTDVYYNNAITRKIQFMKATAKQNEIGKYTLKIGDVIITKEKSSDATAYNR